MPTKAELQEKVEHLTQQLALVRAQRDAAWTETWAIRARYGLENTGLVAPSTKEETSMNKFGETIHVHERERDVFGKLDPYRGRFGPGWDGHTDEEKWDRVRRSIAA